MSTPYYATEGGPVVVQGHVVGGVPVDSSSNKNSNSSSGGVDIVGGDADSWGGKGEAQPKRCNDAFFGILFYAHLGVIAWSAVTYAPQMYEAIAGEYGGQRRLALGGSGSKFQMFPRFLQENDNNGEVEALQMKEVLIILAISGTVGFVMSSLALSFMMTFARPLIKVALIFNVVMSGLMALVALISGVIPVALMCLLGFAFSAYYAYCVWNRIPFAAANMVTAITAVRANLGVSFFAYLSLLLTFGWTVWWSFAFVATNFVANGCDAEGVCDTEPNGWIVFLFLVSYFWTMQVVKNVTHVTVAGTVGTWWFAPEEARSCCSSAVTSSWVRAMTFSFGSICFGSLIVAIIQAIKQVVYQLREQDDSILACCAECLLGCIERIVEYFNQWAFVFVGLYGYSFMEAGKNVMTLFKSRGWTVIIADMLVDSVLTMVAVVVGLLTGVLAIVGAQASGVDLSQGKAAAPFLLGFLFGFALAATLFSVVSSAVNTVIVCYAEAPSEFQQNHPQLSEEMRAAWRQAWPNEFAY